MNVTSEDNGFTLTCIAENVVGMSNASVALTVHCEWAPLWRAAGALGVSAQEAGRGGAAAVGLVHWEGRDSCGAVLGKSSQSLASNPRECVPVPQKVLGLQLTSAHS